MGTDLSIIRDTTCRRVTSTNEHSLPRPTPMRVLVSAFACEPGQGSENEVGFQAARAAASAHEVWLLTLSPNVPSIRRALENDPVGSRIHVEGVDFGVSGEEFDHLSMLRFQRFYDRWQRDVGKRALALDRVVGFDVVHHVTLASYWTRAGVAILDKPFVWGPVGGGVNPPLRLMTELGPRGVVEDVGRMLVRPVVARLPPIRHAKTVSRVAFAQNKATKRALGDSRRIVILSNALAAGVKGYRSPTRRSAEILVVGRLLPWKGPALALRMMRHVRHPGALLRFCGDGPERRRLQRMARRWGLTSRIAFDDWIPRDALLSEIAGAGVLVHPSLHEEAGLCIAEALSLGTPVVCLDHGGPAELVRCWPDAASARIPPTTPEETARKLAAAVDAFLATPAPIPDRPSDGMTSFRERLLWAYDTAVERRGVVGRIHR
jgi:glycosyltransferase involved in cell wall biosynthesis